MQHFKLFQLVLEMMMTLKKLLTLLLLVTGTTCDINYSGASNMSRTCLGEDSANQQSVELIPITVSQEENGDKVSFSAGFVVIMTVSVVQYL